MPAASGQEGLSSSPQGHLGLCLFPAQASSKRHLSLQVGAGCLRCSESRRGGSRLGRQVTLLCVGQSLPASPQDFTTTCCPAGASLGSPQAGARLSFTHRPGASSPLSPLRLRLVDTSPSTEKGGWLCPRRMLDGCCCRRIGHHGLANWQGRAPGPQRQSLQTVPKGWGYELGSPGTTGPSQPPSLQLV